MAHGFKRFQYSHVTGDGGVSGHRLRRQVIVAVGAVEEGFPPLAVHKVSLKDQARTRTRHGIQGTPSWRRAIVHVKATEKERKRRYETNKQKNNNSQNSNLGKKNTVLFHKKGFDAYCTFSQKAYVHPSWLQERCNKKRVILCVTKVI